MDLLKLIPTSETPGRIAVNLVVTGHGGAIVCGPAVVLKTRLDFDRSRRRRVEACRYRRLSATRARRLSSHIATNNGRSKGILPNARHGGDTDSIGKFRSRPNHVFRDRWRSLHRLVYVVESRRGALLQVLRLSRRVFHLSRVQRALTSLRLRRFHHRSHLHGGNVAIATPSHQARAGRDRLITPDPSSFGYRVNGVNGDNRWCPSLIVSTPIDRR